MSDRDSEFNHRITVLEGDMKNEVNGDAPTTIRSRVNALEHDKTTRLAVQATIGAVLTAAVAIGSSGVIGAVDKLRVKLDQATEQRATLRPPLPPAPGVTQ